MKNREINLLILLEGAVFILVLIVSLASALTHGRSREEKREKAPKATVSENMLEDTGQAAVYEEAQITFDAEVEDKLSSMTTEEKVAQLLLVSPEDYTGNDEVSVAGEGCRSAILAMPVGGISCGDHNFIAKETTVENLTRLQSYSMERIGQPLLLWVEHADAGVLSQQVSGIVCKEQEVGMTNLTFMAAETTLSVEDVRQLREGSGFEGVLISGSLTDVASAGDIDVGEAAVQSICAGMSMVYVPSGCADAYQALLQAAGEGTITDAMLHNSVGRILQVKKAIREAEAARQQEALQQLQQQQQQASQQNTGQTSRRSNTNNTGNTGTGTGGNQQPASLAEQQGAAQPEAAQPENVQPEVPQPEEPQQPEQQPETIQPEVPQPEQTPQEEGQEGMGE